MSSNHRMLAAALLAAALAGCSGPAAPSASRTAPQPASGAASSDAAWIAKARADSLRNPYVEADVEFMYNMIGHHTQAITMARMAPTHGASPEVQRLAARIINAQHDEIATMERWLRDRQKPVPVIPADGSAPMMLMNGETMHMLMPGMLTPPQLQALDAARGEAFDKLFLTDMISHHRGAVSMVKDLFGSYGAAQDELVFKFANDVNVDQTTEINRMEKMLAAITLGITLP
ncbi:MAG TPA: DUF305 domain-containing protein [Gemmatimonadaceae bacterium]|nr:DUF305 domain-containing protein [Gemmatimonadaceae bacterium]